MIVIDVERNFETFEHQQGDGGLIEGLPVLSPTEDPPAPYDMTLQVTNAGVPTAYIRLHLEHMSKNFSYFKDIKDKYERFPGIARPVSFEFLYKPEDLCSYLASAYEETLTVRLSNCVAFLWLAKFFDDTTALPGILQFIERNISAVIVFDVLDASRQFDQSCFEYLRDFGLNNLMTLQGGVNILTKHRFLEIMERADIPIKTLVHLQKAWLVGNFSDQNVSEIILDTDYSACDNGDKLNLQRALVNLMSADMGKLVFNHLFSQS